MRTLTRGTMFVAVLLAGTSRSAAEIDWTKYVEFRDVEDPTTVMRSTVKPWRDEEKAQVLELLRTFPDEGEGMLVRATAYEPMRFYRIADPKAVVAGRVPGTLFALAHHLSYGVYFHDEFFKPDLRDDPLFIRWTLFHEFAHLADVGPAGLSESAAWAKLVDERIRQVKANVAALGPSPKAGDYRLAAGRAGMPSYYAAANRSEALAEYATTYLIEQVPMSAENFEFPDDVRGFLKAEIFALPYVADRSYKLVYEGRNLRERERKFDAAIAKANEAIEVNPKNLHAYYLRGLTYMEQKKNAEAIADLEKTLSMYETDGPYRTTIHKHLGELFGRQNDDVRALEHLRLAAATREPEALALLSAALVRAKQFDEAIEVQDKLVALTPATNKYDRARALLARAGVKLDKPDAAAAQADLEAVTALDPADPALYAARGHFWRLRGDHEQFEADFARAIELAPSDMSLIRARAAARQARGAHREAIADYDVLLAANKFDVDALVGRGKSRLASGDHEGAAADADTVLKVFPRPVVDVVQLRTDARIAAGDREKCLAELDALIARFPTVETWKTMRADAVKRLDNPVKPKTAERQETPAVVPSSTAPSTASAAAAGPKPGDVVKNSVGMRFRLLPAGEFQMGSKPDDAGAAADESPQHRVRITRPFWMGVHEVTQVHFEEVCRRNPSWFNAAGGGKDKVGRESTAFHPVENVRWIDAEQFCRLLSEIPEEKEAGRTYRLPTEAEWEYACRAGTTTPYYFGATLSGNDANVDDRTSVGRPVRGPMLERTADVERYKPNAFGLYDMHGNVAEWCADWYDQDYYARSPVDDPRGPDTGTQRIYRGGAWAPTSGSRSAERSRADPDDRMQYVGFRVVCEIDPRAAAAVAATTASDAAPSAAAAEAGESGAVEPGFTALFDGRTLDGWLAPAGAYAVEDGAIVFKSVGNKNLLSKKEYSDFVLRFDFKLSPGANNGVAVRCPSDESALDKDLSDEGVEIQILDDTAPQFADLTPAQYHGSIYGAVAAKRGLLKPVGQWNSQEVTADGRRIQVVLNGRTILDADLAQPHAAPFPDGKEHPGLARAGGRVGFLGLTGRVEFRNIRIKDLAAASGAAATSSPNAPAANEQPALPPDQCVVELDLPAGAVVLMDGKSYGDQRRFQWDSLPAGESYVSQLRVRFADGGEARRAVPIRGGLKLKLPFRAPNRIVWAYWPDEPKNADLFSIRGDGGDARRVNDWAGGENVPMLSPDAATIAYVANADGGNKIHLVDLDGSNPRLLTPNPLTTHQGHYVWSADGTKIAFSGWAAKGKTWLFVSDLVAGETKNMCEGTDPSWSPDGKRLVFKRYKSSYRDTELIVLDVASGTETRLVEGRDPAWSPDGSRIAFLRLRVEYSESLERNFDRYDLYVVDPDGGGERLLVAGVVGLVPIWSPDGTRLLFQKIENDDNLVVLDVDSGRQTVVARGQSKFDVRSEWEEDVRAPCWSPDGTQIAYVRSRTPEIPADADPDEATFLLVFRVAWSRLEVVGADGRGARVIADYQGVHATPDWR